MYLCSLFSLSQSWGDLSSGVSLSSEPPFIHVLFSPLMCRIDRISKAAEKSDAGETEGGWGIIGRIQTEQPDVSELNLLALACCPTSEFNASAQRKTGCFRRAEIKRGNWLPAHWRHLRSTHRHLQKFIPTLHSSILKDFVEDSRRCSHGYQVLILMWNPEVQEH